MAGPHPIPLKWLGLQRGRWPCYSPMLLTKQNLSFLPKISHVTGPCYPLIPSAAVMFQSPGPSFLKILIPGSRLYHSCWILADFNIQKNDPPTCRGPTSSSEDPVFHPISAQFPLSYLSPCHDQEPQSIPNASVKRPTVQGLTVWCSISNKSLTPPGPPVHWSDYLLILLIVYFPPHPT